MKLQTRLALLMVLLVLLPALPAAWMARELVTRSLNLGLSSDVDRGLDAGVRQARQTFLEKRRAVSDSLGAWVERFATPAPAVEELVARAGGRDGDLLPAGWTSLRTSKGEIRTLRGSPAGSGGAATTSSGQDPGTAATATRDGAGGPEAPPSVVRVSRQLSDGSVLTLERPTDPAWREDARTLASGLQLVRALKSQRQELERGFWIPFLALYAVTLLAALAAAALLARGIVRPLTRLLQATRAIGGGDWTVRVPASGRDEIALLSRDFNDMVRRLDAQSRRLVDLETMAGWREMARALAHEVKNPLTPIQLTVEEIRERYRGDDPQYKSLLEECTRIIVQEVESLRNLVARFREFSRPVEPKFAPVDLNALVADIGALQRDLEVEQDLSPVVGPMRGDDDRLRQMLMNLCRNAQAATAAQKPPRLRLATRPAAGGAVLEVEDNGPGIPAGERERVFEPYRSGFKGGLGLGLALVKGIVLAHRGTIRVEEGQWGGARFVINLPRDPEAEHE
jgi:nitrogen fixation/metabolism regulation signal transduction histidine kinase